MASKDASATCDSSPKYVVAFQGEQGAYSEAAVFSLLGRKDVRPVGFPSFDEAFSACSNREVDLLMVPIENSLGGTIHANCDLQLQHNLFIIAEHDFRVRHSLMALPGTKVEELTKIISHPQALAQCDSYIKKLGKKGESAYDTAGSAKLVSEGKLTGVAAICSEHAAQYYGLEVLDRGIEDDSHNFTRFLLLRTNPVRVPAGVKCKTSIVFSMGNISGALFKALSVFALRDIDLSKIESRPCKPDIMDKYERLCWSMGGGMWKRSDSLLAPGEGQKKATRDDDVRAHYKYLFYADFLAPVENANSANAIQHLQEMTTFFRVLGSYPEGGSLMGLDNLGPHVLGQVPKKTMRMGVLGFGNFGQFISRKFASGFDVFATSREDCSDIAAQIGVSWCDTIDKLLAQRLDVLVIAVSILSFETVLRKLASCIAQSEGLSSLLVADVLSVKVHAKTTMLAVLPESCDIVCTHPMFGPESGKHGWGNLPFVFDRIRTRDARRCEDYLNLWSDQGCRMVDMTCEMHDEYTAGSQFVTHFTGRVLSRLNLKTTPINTKGFDSLLHLVDNTCRDSFDLFFALFRCNPNSAQQLKAFEEAIAEVSQELQRSMLDDGARTGAEATSVDSTVSEQR